MNTVRTTQKKILKGMLIATALLSVLCLILFDNPKPMIVGLFFGAIVSALLFIELGITLNRAVTMPPHKAQKYATSRYLLRFTIMGIVLYASIGAPHIHLLGTAMGLIIIKPVIYATHLFNDKQYFKNILRRKEDESDGR